MAIDDPTGITVPVTSRKGRTVVRWVTTTDHKTIGYLYLITSFLFFLGSLWGAMRRAEGGGGFLSATAFGAGVMSITIKLASAAPVLAARANTGELDPNLTGALQDINNASFALTFFPLAAMLAAFALVAIRSKALPGWLGWAAAPLSVAFAVGGIAGSADLASEWAGLASGPVILFESHH